MQRKKQKHTEGSDLSPHLTEESTPTLPFFTLASSASMEEEWLTGVSDSPSIGVGGVSESEEVNSAILALFNTPVDLEGEYSSYGFDSPSTNNRSFSDIENDEPTYLAPPNTPSSWLLSARDPFMTLPMQSTNEPACNPDISPAAPITPVQEQIQTQPMQSSTNEPICNPAIPPAALITSMQEQIQSQPTYQPASFSFYRKKKKTTFSFCEDKTHLPTFIKHWQENSNAVVDAFNRLRVGKVDSTYPCQMRALIVLLGTDKEKIVKDFLDKIYYDDYKEKILNYFIANTSSNFEKYFKALLTQKIDSKKLQVEFTEFLQLHTTSHI